MDDSLRKKIEERAYQLFLQRNGVDGYHIEDWLAAEQEIVGVSTQPVSSSPKKASASRKKNIV
jgi:hypothetical protein